MRLTVATPLAIAVDAGDVAGVRAEDASGGFGILPGHADFLTALPPSVISWRDRAGGQHHVAVRGGMLAVAGGATVSVATREAIRDDDLVRLETEVVARFRQRLAEEQVAHADAQRLYVAAIRRIGHLVRPSATPAGWLRLGRPGDTPE